MAIGFLSAVRSPTKVQAFACLALALQIAQLLCLVFLAHPLVASNSIQILLPLAVAAGCWSKERTFKDTRDQRAWTLLTIAFLLWAAAEGCFVVKRFVLPHGNILRSTNDVLSLLFAVPLLLVLSGSLEGKLDWVSWLDQFQAFLFFAVVSLLVYSQASVLTFERAYGIQNVALLLSCFLRYSTAATRYEKRFFGRLAVYLLVYLFCAGLANALAHRGWSPGSLVDLLWTLSQTTFCLLLLSGTAEFRSETRNELHGSDNLTRYLHDLSALGLTVLSMGASIYLALHWAVPGTACLLCSFAAFAVRTCGRERALHQANDQLHKSVMEDALTGVGNRACLRRHLNHLLATPSCSASHPVAIMYIDLDRFKAINDSLGHEAGDKVIREMAERLRAACQHGDVICRLGGDEFVIILQGDAAAAAENRAATVLTKLRAPLWVDTKILQLSGSIGVAVSRGDDDPDSLLRKADYAMYRAKRLGKNRVEICDGSLSSSLHAGYMLQTDLRECLEREEIGVVLQPIFSLLLNDVCGFEALARWSHPHAGCISPGEFIPIAEETGMILELGRQVLQRACGAVVLWNRTWETRLSLSVNVSARQFSDANLLDSILRTLASTGLDPHLLHLEITESVLLVGEDSVANVLAEAQRLGIQISLDDFGTGYSSLSHLLRFPTDEVKIDRSFVQGLHQDRRRAELVRTVLQLGRSLQKRIIAEGVETEEEFLALQEMGCKYIQGNFIAKPFPVESAAEQNAYGINRFHLHPVANEARTLRVI